jgi:signal transduction histidine kinase
LQQLCDATTSRARAHTALEIEGGCIIPTDVKLTLYRIAQEALNNVIKHAAASRVEVVLRCEEDADGVLCVALRVRDDGRGFDPATIPPDHFGVGIMHERAEAIGATLTVESGIGEGTEVVVEWVGDSPSQ